MPPENSNQRVERHTDQGVLRFRCNITASGITKAINQQRAAMRLKDLVFSSDLDTAARAKLGSLLKHADFAHRENDGTYPSDYLAASGSDYLRFAELLAQGKFQDATAVVKAWQASPSHKQSLANPAYTDFGLALARVKQNKDCLIVLFMAGH